MPIPLSLLFAYVCLQEPTQDKTTAPLPTAVPQTSLATAPVFADPARLRRSPKLDGKIEEEEWDLLNSTTDTKTYFQWEPGFIHVAAVAPAGKDLLVSLDLKGDGWLIGSDNLEVRVSQVDGKAKITARMVDATNPAGPAWIPIPGFALASKAAVGTDGTQTVYELSIGDPGINLIPQDNRKIAARVDVVGSTETFDEPYKPRVLGNLVLTDVRSAALPSGLRWNSEKNQIPIVPGEGGFMRLTFNGDNKLGLKRIELKSEGLAKDSTATLGIPFPQFDAKGRAIVDYLPKVAPSAELGYRVLRATVTGADGVPGVMEVSYRIAQPMDVDLVTTMLKRSDKDRGLKMPFYLASNTRYRVRGEVTIVVPEGFRIMNGGEQQKFTISDTRSKTRRMFELFVPSTAVGTYPIVFKADVNGQKTEYTTYLTIQ